MELLKKTLKSVIRKSGLLNNPKETINTSDMIPELHDIFIGDGDYQIIGEFFFELFKRKGKLLPHHRVLDMGCGQGRMAIPLLQYLDNEGSYEGFDIAAQGIEWCREKIPQHYPRFHFKHGDIYNKLYNPGGKMDESEFPFPYDNNEFDFIFLTSVFTHLRPESVRNYLSEIHRVMKVGGRCLFTTFILDDIGKINGEKGISKFSFNYAVDNFWTCDQEIPEAAIAYSHMFWVEELRKYGLKIVEPVELGHWRYSKTYTPGHGQDIFIVTKEETT